MGISRARSKTNSISNDKSKRRTPRACDRCRLKKAKCDGTASCKTCQATDSRCLYTVKRVREARSHYYQMREVMDKGLQRLYWACRSASGFPGDIPDESQGPPSTTAILNALGLRPPSLQDTKNFQKSMDVLPSNSINHAEGYRYQGHTVPSSPGCSPIQDECLPSPATSSFSMSSITPSPKTKQYPSTVVSPRPAPPPKMDMSEQFFHAPSENAASSRSSSLREGKYTNNCRPLNTVFDMDSFLDTRSCSPPCSGHTMHNFYTSMQFDMSTMSKSSSHAPPDATMASAW